jgi:hypothetical protein
MAYYELTRDEIRELDRTPRGAGGFQTLIRRLQKQLNHATGNIRLSAGDVEEIQHIAFDYKQGGFQDRLLAIFGRVLGPGLGREE